MDLRQFIFRQQRDNILQEHGQSIARMREINTLQELRRQTFEMIDECIREEKLSFLTEFVGMYSVVDSYKRAIGEDQEYVARIERIIEKFIEKNMYRDAATALSTIIKSPNNIMRLIRNLKYMYLYTTYGGGDKKSYLESLQRLNKEDDYELESFILKGGNINIELDIKKALSSYKNEEIEKLEQLLNSFKKPLIPQECNIASFLTLILYEKAKANCKNANEYYSKSARIIKDYDILNNLTTEFYRTGVPSIIKKDLKIAEACADKMLERALNNRNLNEQSRREPAEQLLKIIEERLKKEKNMTMDERAKLMKKRIETFEYLKNNFNDKHAAISVIKFKLGSATTIDEREELLNELEKEIDTTDESNKVTAQKLYFDNIIEYLENLSEKRMSYLKERIQLIEDFNLANTYDELLNLLKKNSQLESNTEVSSESIETFSDDTEVSSSDDIEVSSSDDIEVSSESIETSIPFNKYDENGRRLLSPKELRLVQKAETINKMKFKKITGRDLRFSFAKKINILRNIIVHGINEILYFEISPASLLSYIPDTLEFKNVRKQIIDGNLENFDYNSIIKIIQHNINVFKRKLYKIKNIEIEEEDFKEAIVKVHTKISTLEYIKTNEAYIEQITEACPKYTHEYITKETKKLNDRLAYFETIGLRLKTPYIKKSKREIQQEAERFIVNLKNPGRKQPIEVANATRHTCRLF